MISDDSISTFHSSLVVEHDMLMENHNKTLGDLDESQKKGAAIAEKRDIMDVDNKKLRAENTKLSIELTDFKKALARSVVFWDD
jgi:hypothetical protein